VKTKIILLFLLLFHFQFVNGRTDNEPGIIYWNRICIKTAPFAFIDVYNGSSPRIGMEFRSKSSVYAIYNEIGTYFRNSKEKSNIEGFLVKCELKKYIKKFTNKFFSIEFFYKHQSYDTFDSIEIQPYYLKYYHVSKNVYCLTFKYGSTQMGNNRFIGEAFVGIGIRYKLTKSTLTHDENNYIMPSVWHPRNIMINQAGHFLYPNIDLGIKIGYCIKKQIHYIE
jgi:hypothetical protein